MFSVENFLNIVAFQDFKIISGRRGLSNSISSVNIMDNPDAIDWFSAGEVLLTSGFFFKDSTNLQNKIMYQLKSINCPALCIKPQRYLKKIPENMIDLSNQLNLPIIELPYGFSFSKIMNRVNEELTDKYDQLNKESIDIAKLFFNLSIHGGGLKSIAQKLNQLLQSTTLLCDIHWNIINHENTKYSTLNKAVVNKIINNPSSLFDNIIDKLPHELNQIQKPISRQVVYMDTEFCILIMPVYFQGKHYGYIVICGNTNIVNEFTYITLEQGAMAFALERIKYDEIKRAKHRVKRDFILDLVSGRISSENELNSLAEEHHIDTNLFYTAIKFKISYTDLSSITDRTLRNQEENKQMKRLLNYLEQHNLSHNESSLFFSQQNYLIFLLGRSTEDLSAKTRMYIEKKIESITKKFPSIDLKAGIGRSAQDLLHVCDSYEEADKTLSTMEAYPEIIVGHFNDFVVEHLLLDHIPTEIIQPFINTVLGPLLSSNQKYRNEFFSTLDCLVKHRINIAETARTLYLHRNTLLYRMARLEEILDIDFKNNDDILKIELALKLYSYKY